MSSMLLLVYVDRIFTGTLKGNQLLSSATEVWYPENCLALN